MSHARQAEGQAEAATAICVTKWAWESTCASAHEARQAAVLLCQEAQAQAHFPLTLHLCQERMTVHHLWRFTA